MRGDIGRSLRELREASGKEAKAVARSALMSQSKLSRIETGKAAPTAMDVERVLAALGVSGEIRANLAEVARREATEATAWRLYRRSGLHHHQDDIRAMEADTTVMRLFQPSCIPGLCQTPEYIRAVFVAVGLTEDVISRTIGTRLQRQAEMAVQLDRLVTLSRLPTCGSGSCRNQHA